MTTIQEYDLEFKPTTIVRSQGLCKLVEKALDPIDSSKKARKMRYLSTIWKFCMFL
jgi:hypothetical protein